MKKVLFTLGFITQIAFAQVPGFSWATGLTGNAGNDFGLATATDNLGNVYSTGAFKGTIDADPGPAFFALASAGLNDCYIQKLSPAGNLIWALRIGSNMEEVGRGIAIDANGNILVTGNFSSATTDFDPGAGVANLSTNGTSDIFILKLSSAGSFIWAKNIGSTADDMGYTICADPNSNVIIGGHFNGTVDFDPGIGNTILTSSPSFPDAFVMKLDANGNFIWVDQFSGTGNDYVNAVKTNANGEIGLVGYFEGAMDIDPSTIVTNNVNALGLDGFIVKLSNNGNFIWGQDMGSSGNDVYYDLQFDHNYNIVATGYTDGAADFDPSGGLATIPVWGGYEVFVQKLDSANNFQWVKGFGYTGNDNGYGIDVDDAGNVLTTGFFTGAVDFDPGVGTTNLISAGAVDGFIQKMDMDGNFLWAKKMGGTLDDIPRGISLDPFGNIAVSGYYSGTADFDPSPSTFNLTSGGGSDVFVVRFQCLPTTSSTNIISCGNYNSPSGNYVWTTNGIYQDTIANQGGCDSLLTINLTVLNSSTSNLSDTNCVFYTSPSGNYNWYTSGVYQDTIPNHVGCDSVITCNITVINADTTVSFNAGTFTSNEPGAIYQWFICLGEINIVGATNQSYTPTSNGGYGVHIFIDDCIFTSSCHTINGVGVENNSNKNVSIFPNPALTSISIQSGSEILSVKLMDLSGKILPSSTHLNTSQTTIDVSLLEAGIYFIEVQNYNGIITKKIIKK